jgi:hypothetical protein
MIDNGNLFEFFGPWAVALVILVGVLTYFIRRDKSIEASRNATEKSRDDSQDRQNEALIASVRDSISLLARAVDRFESFEREEAKSNNSLFIGMKNLVDAQARIIETQSRLTETLAKISDTQLQQKYLLKDIARDMRLAWAERRESLELTDAEDGEPDST